MRILLRLALCLGLSLPGTPLLAHALPGTDLVIRVDAESTTLTVSMPLHELDLAMPGGSGLGPEPTQGPVTGAERNRIADYLAAHLALTDAARKAIDLRLSAARIESAHAHHVGTYTVLVIDLAGPAAAFPLTLRHDAILHEVRSHRAAVFLQGPEAVPVPLVVIAIDPASGTAPVVTIPAQP